VNPGVVIAGGGLAAQRCCERLRRDGYEGRVTIVSDEALPPYDRPPLSKEHLAGHAESGALCYRSEDWYRDHEIALLLGNRAASLDAAARRIELADGRPLPYERLLIATGARPRTLPAVTRFENAHTLRSAADAERLRAALRPGVRLAVIGAGFIGQEVAATARAAGAQVTIVEAAAAPLLEVLGPQLGGWFARLHREEGVDVRLDTQVTSFDGNGRVEQLVLADGAKLGCDELLVGIGVEPACDWLAGSPLEGDGVRVDREGRTGIPDVFAAGDVAYRVCPGGRRLRGEHWEAAAGQGAAAARAMLDLPPRPAPPTSFWSDLYGTRVQYVGDGSEADSVELDGSPTRRDFSAVYLRGRRPVAGLLVGRPRALPELRRLIAASPEHT
jgi:3-phenylpropionate/trans-cinnamate dioxygenase ferredoxin reductase component